MWNIRIEQQNLQTHFGWLIYISLSRSQKHLAVCWWQDLWLWNFSGISLQRLSVHKSILIAILQPRKFCFHIIAVPDGELQQQDVIYRLQLSLCLLCLTYFLLCFFTALHPCEILGKLCFSLLLLGSVLSICKFLLSLGLQVCLSTNARWRCCSLPFPFQSCSSPSTGWTRKNLEEIIWE